MCSNIILHAINKLLIKDKIGVFQHNHRSVIKDKMGTQIDDQRWNGDKVCEQTRWLLIPMGSSMVVGVLVMGST